MLRCPVVAGRLGLPATAPPCCGAPACAGAPWPAASCAGAALRFSGLSWALAGIGGAAPRVSLLALVEPDLAQPASPAVSVRPRRRRAAVARRTVLGVMRLRRDAGWVRFRQTGGWTITIERRRLSCG